MTTPNILKVSIHRDLDCEDPTKMDCEWSIYTLKNRGNHLKTDVDRGRFYDEDDDGEETLNANIQDKLDRGYAFWLRYSEHGICNYDTTDDPDYADGLIVWEHPEDEIGGKTIDELRKDADSFLEEYTMWANGQCFGYRVARVKSITPEYDPDKNLDNGAYWEELDSCWGFIGEEYVKSVIKSVLEEYPDARVVYKGDAAHIMR